MTKGHGKILSQDTNQIRSIAEDVVEFVEEDLGYEREETIPGLLIASRTLLQRTEDPEQALDEAVAVLEDGLDDEDGEVG